MYHTHSYLVLCAGLSSVAGVTRGLEEGNEAHGLEEGSEVQSHQAGGRL